MNTTYVIKLNSPTNTNRNNRFLRSVRKDRITETRYPTSARTFQSAGEAQALILQIQYQIRTQMSVVAYHFPVKETAQ
jgi:hypothetical protein